MLLLPKGNRDTVEVLFTFLKWVASFSHVDEETGNKMDMHNLATVISPNIFRSSPAKGTDTVRVESFESIRVMDSLLEHQDEFYLVPEEFLPALRDQEYFGTSMELPSKEFLRKCEAYHRVRANGRIPAGLSSPIQMTPTNSPFGIPASGSTSSTATNKDNSESRIIPQQRSDPALSRGRQQQHDNAVHQGRNGYYPSAPQSLERGQSAATMPELQAQQRNAYAQRQQSPPPRLTHQPFSHPSAGMPTSPSQSQPMLPRTGTPMSQDTEWSAQNQQQAWMPTQPNSQSSAPLMPSTSPRSYTPRSSGEHKYDELGFVSNGHTR